MSDIWSRLYGVYANLNNLYVINMIGKNKDGVLYFSVRYKDPQGNIKQKTVQNRSWTTKKEAKAAADLFLLSVTEQYTKLTMNQLYELYTQDRADKTKLKTQYMTDNVYKTNIQPYLGEYQVLKITPRTVIQWQTWLVGKGFKNTYLSMIQQKLRTILNFGVNQQYISSSPYRSKEVKNPMEHKVEMSYWTIEEFKRFIVRESDPIYHALFMTLYWTGIRRGEALALTIGDVDFINNIITVNKTWDHHNMITTSPKTNNSYRKVQMTGELRNELKVIVDNYSTVEGFNSKAILFGYNKHINEQTLKDHQVAACKLSGVKVIKIHEFRHSHASLLVNMGFPTFEVAKRLGHTQAMVENVYGHWYKENQDIMINKLDSIAEEAEEKYRKSLSIN